MTLPLGLALAVPLAPLLWWQGRRVRRVTPVLPEAEGSRCGESGPHDATPLRLLVLGDSSAAGVGAAHQTEALAGHLTRRLRAHQGIELPERLRWTVQARTGTRTRDALSLLDALSPEPFDLAVVALGVNDVTALTTPTRWLSDVERLVTRLRTGFAVRQVLWSALPPMHRFSALPQPLRAVMGRHARDLDAALRRQAQRAGPHWLTHVAMPAMQRADWLARDGFHPSPPAYEAWAAVLARAIVASARPAD